MIPWPFQKVEYEKIVLYSRRSQRRVNFWEIVLITLNDGLMKFCQAFLLGEFA